MDMPQACSKYDAWNQICYRPVMKFPSLNVMKKNMLLACCDKYFITQVRMNMLQTCYHTHALFLLSGYLYILADCMMKCQYSTTSYVGYRLILQKILKHVPVKIVNSSIVFRYVIINEHVCL